MKNFFKNIYFSYFLLLLFSLIYGLDVISGDKITALVYLQPSLIINNMQLWRLVSYPLASGSFEGFLFFVLTFYLISTKLEIIFNRSLFALLVFLLICMQGTLISLIFWQKDYAFMGMEGISAFVITLFSLLNLNKKDTLWYLQPLKSYFIVSLIVLIWLFGTAIHLTINPNFELFMQKVSAAGFGLVSGSFLYLQLIILRKTKKMIYPKPDIPTPEELSMAMISKSQPKKNLKQRNDFSSHQEFEEFSESQLNEILDKINENGKESLTEEEIRYLKEYSRHID